MKSLDEVIGYLQSRSDCSFRPATRLPEIADGLRLPDDLVAFYQRFSEARLFGAEGFGLNDPICHILPPEKVVQIGYEI